MAKQLGEGIVSRGGEVMNVDPLQVAEREGWNTRDDYGDMASLKASISEFGVRRPLELRREGDNSLTIIAGHRRHRACLELIEEGYEILSYPAIIRPRGFSQSEALINMCLENEGKPFEPIELGRVYKRFMDWGWTQSQIATRFGKSQAHVSQLLTLAGAAPEVQAAVAAKEITVTQAIGAVRQSTKAEPVDDGASATATPEQRQVELTERLKQHNAAPRQTGRSKQETRFLKMLRAELATTFKSLENLRLHQKDVGIYAESHLDAYNAGRLSVLCELCGKDMDIADIETLLAETMEEGE